MNTSVLQQQRPHTTELITGAFIAAVLGICALNNLPHLVVLGPTTFNAVIAAAIPMLCVPVVLVSGRLVTSGISPISIYFLFCAYAFVLFVFAPRTIQSLQNMTMYAGVGAVALVAFQYAGLRQDAAAVIVILLKRISWAAALLYIGFTLGGESGFQGIYSPRTYALFAIIGCAIYVAEARVGTPNALPKAVLFCALCLMTISRTAAIMSLIVLTMISFDVQRIRSWFVSLIGIMLATVAYILVVQFVPQFGAAFSGGDQALSIAGFSIDTKGRLYWWSLLWTSFLANPVWGNGVGSAAMPIAAELNILINPHNDHLRLLHDTGIVGYALWWAAILRTVYLILTAWKADTGLPEDRSENVLFMTTLLFLGSFVAVMITDNVLIYHPVAIPLAVMLGASAAIAGRRRAHIKWVVAQNACA